MGEDNSPYFAAGLADGLRDAELESQCPPEIPLGMDPAREWSWMYKRGYERGYVPVPCMCDGSCQLKAAANGGEMASLARLMEGS